MAEIISAGRYVGRMACPDCGQLVGVWDDGKSAVMFCARREFSHHPQGGPVLFIGTTDAARRLMRLGVIAP